MASQKSMSRLDRERALSPEEGRIQRALGTLTIGYCYGCKKGFPQIDIQYSYLEMHGGFNVNICDGCWATGNYSDE